MKRFEDRDRRLWDVIAGRQSWGANYALFVPARGTADEIRQTLLRAASFEDAVMEIDSLDDEGLQQLLDNSTIKEE
ncbi:MAG TPA: hypothetical protein VMM79_17125 [Longimicrobiales bacterium]|nr:hypothetical protein [Longimicrobiales bacterium]